MRWLFVFLGALLLASLAYSELTVFAAQIPESGAVRYSVAQRGASGSHLFITVKKGDTQVQAFEVQDFSGVANGYISLAEGGTYRLIAVEADSGDYAEAQFEFAAPQPSVPPSSTPTSLVRGIPDYLILIAAALAAVLVFLLMFSNPLRQKPKK
ncbi:MAG: hypothetical protein PHQ80_01175 [Candidatus ainarchaeum sp.]|nr:hypothetical protein [Candidatus ainarchaeum sp.]MDD5095956.1 hypothetical protein [Candidatus ainarchaeum sp.]